MAQFCLVGSTRGITELEDKTHGTASGLICTYRDYNHYRHQAIWIFELHNVYEISLPERRPLAIARYASF